MSTQAITNSGRALFASKQASGQALDINRFMLANIGGLDQSAPVNLEEAIPDVADQVKILPVTKAGYISPDEVVYSLYLPSSEGNYTYNWLGLMADDDTLVAVAYLAPVNKEKSENGSVGNTLNENIMLAFTDAQSITSLVVDASTWQWQFDEATNIAPGLVELAEQSEMTAGQSNSLVPPVSVVHNHVSVVIAQAIADIVDSSPAALDTLNELASALGDDPNFAASVNAQIATKATKGANDSFEDGTTMIFFQSAAPAGWVKETGHNNKAIRIVSGNGGGFGGSVDFLSALKSQTITGTVSNTKAGGSVSIGNTSITLSQSASHRHRGAPNANTGSWKSFFGVTAGGGSTWAATSGAYNTAYAALTDYQGGNGAHGHSAAFSGVTHGHNLSGDAIDLAVKYIDAIICRKEAA